MFLILKMRRTKMFCCARKYYIAVLVASFLLLCLYVMYGHNEHTTQAAVREHAQQTQALNMERQKKIRDLRQLIKETLMSGQNGKSKASSNQQQNSAQVQQRQNLMQQVPQDSVIKGYPKDSMQHTHQKGSVQHQHLLPHMKEHPVQQQTEHSVLQHQVKQNPVQEQLKPTTHHLQPEPTIHHTQQWNNLAQGQQKYLQHRLEELQQQRQKYMELRQRHQLQQKRTHLQNIEEKQRLWKQKQQELEPRPQQTMQQPTNQNIPSTIHSLGITSAHLERLKLTNRITNQLKQMDERLLEKLPPANSLMIDHTKILPTVMKVTYSDALKTWASKNKDIILVYVDLGFLDMAFNFIEVSIIPNNISNILMTADSTLTCIMVEYVGVPCFVVKTDFQNNHPGKESAFGSEEFIAKMNIRIDMILDAINLGYNVLHSDSDIVYLKNPFSFIDCKKNCDVAALWDSTTLNAGFLYIKSSAGSKWLYSQMKSYARIHPDVNDQINLDKNVHMGTAQGKLQYIVLNQRQFLSGQAYFEPNRHFAEAKRCQECIVIHDNWIVSHSAKVYRLREHLMWMYDHNQYYSNESRKYLTYSNPHYFNVRNTVDEEIQALKNALIIGYMLNRTVILPTFHCKQSRIAHCSLLSILRVSKLDEFFKNQYREHMFLSHPKVPRSITTVINPSSEYVITNDIYNKLSLPYVTVFEASNKTLGPTEKEILSWFSDSKSPVLKFHSMYGNAPQFESLSANQNFQQKLKQAFHKAQYRQY